MKSVVFTLAISLLALPAFSQTFKSSGQPPLLVELYTSEGCSSCPPADDYLGKLVDHPGLWTEIVPIAFHVDYWDYLGWEDRFAKAEYSQRQRYLKQAGAIKAVYTPGWVVDGQEWRDYFRRAPLPQQPDRQGGDLTAEINEQGAVTIRYEHPLQDSQPYYAYISLLSFDLETDVAGGENRGERLDHEFVVVEHQVKRFDETLELQLNALSDEQRQGLVVWVAPEGSQRPEQVLGGWITSKKQ